MLDEFDMAILGQLQEDGRLSNQALAERVNLSTSPCWRRVKKLEKDGVIEGYAALLDGEKLGLRALAYIHVAMIDHAPRTLDTFAGFVTGAEEVLECSSVTGSYDYILKVVARDSRALEQFLMEKLLRLGIVRETNTEIVLQQITRTTALPLAGLLKGPESAGV